MYWFITSCTRAVANMPIRRLSNIGKDRVGLLVPAPQVLKKKKVQRAGAWVPRTEVLRYSCCQEQVKRRHH